MSNPEPVGALASCVLLPFFPVQPCEHNNGSHFSVYRQSVSATCPFAHSHSYRQMPTDHRETHTHTLKGLHTPTRNDKHRSRDTRNLTRGTRVWAQVFPHTDMHVNAPPLAWDCPQTLPYRLRITTCDGHAFLSPRLGRHAIDGVTWAFLWEWMQEVCYQIGPSSGCETGASLVKLLKNLHLERIPLSQNFLVVCFLVGMSLVSLPLLFIVIASSQSDSFVFLFCFSFFTFTALHWF